MGVFPSGQWGQTVNLLLSASVVRIHPRPPKKPQRMKVRWGFCITAKPDSLGGWIRTAAATSLKTAQKQPSGLFLAARLAISTRAHQKTSTYESTLRFLFYCKARLTGRVDSNNSGADRCQRQKQGGEAGAAASRMRVPPKARRSRWEPRPGFLFILRGSRRPPCQTLFHRLLLKNAQTKTTVRVDGGSVIA